MLLYCNLNLGVLFLHCNLNLGVLFLILGTASKIYIPIYAYEKPQSINYVFLKKITFEFIRCSLNSQ